MELQTVNGQSVNSTLKAGLEQTNQTSLVELNKTSERLDKVEKTQGDLAKASKPNELQKLSEAVEGLRAGEGQAGALRSNIERQIFASGETHGEHSQFREFEGFDRRGRVVRRQRRADLLMELGPGDRQAHRHLRHPRQAPRQPATNDWNPHLKAGD